MKRVLSIFLFLFIAVFHAEAQNKEEIVPFNKALITTGKGIKSHITWAKFPSQKEKIRKILLKLTLATPQEDYMSCAHWDYLDNLVVVRNGGEKGKLLNYEIARMLTPYGGQNPKDWSFTWEVDVTDFAHILRDSVQFDYVHSGWEPSEDRGWALTTTFEITYGEPAYKTVAIHQVYNDSYKYGHENDPIENHLKPYKIKLSKETNYLRSVTFQTGHGMDSLGNSEFCPKWRKLTWNGKEVSHKELWTEGGDNPLYPQAGTWIYDRGNWIPGMLIDPDVCDLLVKGGSEGEFRLNMEPYIMPNNPTAVQNINSYLIEYKVNKKANDVELSDIIVPSLKDIHSRKNPTTEYPIIKVKNHSAKAVKSMQIKYGKHSELWRGEIAPFGVAEIKLSNRVDNSDSLFVAEILSVNDKVDTYPLDNKMVSPYKAAPIHKGDLVFVVKGNNMSKTQNTATLYNISTGEKVFDYPIGTVEVVRERLKLSDGDYLFEVTDSNGDGLSFWAHKEAGNGGCFILAPNGKMVKYFNPDFGNSIRYWFTVDGSLAEENLRREPMVGIMKREPNKAIVKYSVNSNKEDVKIVVKNYVGKIIDTIVIKDTNEGEVTIDMTSYPIGLYFIEVWQGNYKSFSTTSVAEIKKEE